MRPTALGSPGHAPPEDEGPITVKLEESEEEGEAAPWDPGPEAARQRFRHFRYEEAVGPREALARLRELCRQWLRPEVHSKEQVLELLVLEQFLGALPAEIQARVRGQQPGSPEEAAALVEGLRREPGGPRRWVSRWPWGRGWNCMHLCLFLGGAMLSQTLVPCGLEVVTCGRPCVRADGVPGPASLAHPSITQRHGQGMQGGERGWVSAAGEQLQVVPSRLAQSLVDMGP